jgi:hypothetical protein
MDASSTLDIDVLDTGIIIPVNFSNLNDSVPTETDGLASNVQVSFGDFTYHMLTV